MRGRKDKLDLFIVRSVVESAQLYSIDGLKFTIRRTDRNIVQDGLFVVNLRRFHPFHLEISSEFSISVFLTRYIIRIDTNFLCVFFFFFKNDGNFVESPYLPERIGRSKKFAVKR